VNANGQSVGYCEGIPALEVPAQAFIWSSATGMQFLSPATPGAHCYAEALNDSGQVVGNCAILTELGSVVERFGFSWTSSDGMSEIRAPGSDNCWARFVNESGQVAGYDQIAGKPWSWTEQGGVLVIPGGGVGWNASPLGLTESGHVVGYTTSVSGSPQYAFAWRETEGTSLLYLQQGGNSYPRAWNANGQVSGYSVLNNSYYGFVWSPGRASNRSTQSPSVRRMRTR